jgi:hypothetical protein
VSLNRSVDEKTLKDSNRTVQFSLTKNFIQFPSCPYHFVDKVFNLSAEVDCPTSSSESKLVFKPIFGTTFEIDLNSLLRPVGSTGKCKYAVRRGGKDDPWIFGTPFFQ